MSSPRSLTLTLAMASLFAGASSASAKLEIVHVFRAGASNGMAAGSKQAGNVQKATQSRELRIEIRNTGKDPESNVTIRYWLFGYNLASRRHSLVGGGEETRSLKPGETLNIESSAVTSSYQQPSVVQVAPPAAKPGSKHGGAPGQGHASRHGAKPGAYVPPKPSGTKISGHGVQLIKDGKVIDSEFSDEGLRSLVKATDDKPGTPFVGDSDSPEK